MVRPASRHLCSVPGRAKQRTRFPEENHGRPADFRPTGRSAITQA